MSDKKKLYLLLCGLVMLFASPAAAQLAGAGGSAEHMQMQPATQEPVIDAADLLTESKPDADFQFIEAAKNPQEMERIEIEAAEAGVPCHCSKGEAYKMPERADTRREFDIRKR